MRRAYREDKQAIIDILTRSFSTNLSVNYIVKQDRRREKRIRALMDYSFEMCSLFGEVFISEDKKACALIVYPDKKRVSLKSIWLDMKLLIRCVGLGKLRRTLSRDRLIHNIHPGKNIVYLWFIGVLPSDQKKGSGSELLQSVIDHSKSINRPIYLETSNSNNLPWYQKSGFEIYTTRDLGHKLFFLRRPIEK